MILGGVFVIVFIVLHIYESHIVFSEEAVDESGQVRKKGKKKRHTRADKMKRNKKSRGESKKKSTAGVDGGKSPDVSFSKTDFITEGKSFDEELETKSHGKSAKEIELTSL